MTFLLRRTRYTSDGIFGELLREDLTHLLVTLEHAYTSEDGGCLPKLPPGEYVCVRGKHRLESMERDFETFEITGVPGHKGVLFHSGNYNRDSSGCVLLGKGELPHMITDSRAAFNTFLSLVEGIDSFQLTVC